MMIILTRKKGEAIVIGDSLFVTVLEIQPLDGKVLLGLTEQVPIQHGAAVTIGDVTISLQDIRHDKVRLGVDAPKNVPIHRHEVFEAIHGREASEVMDNGNATTTLWLQMAGHTGENDHQ